MSTACFGCGEPVTSLWAAIVHCDPVEPIDQIDNPQVLRGSD